MRFSLIPREMKFFDLFDEAAATITRAAGKFHELVTSFPHSLRIHLGQADDYYSASPSTLPFSSSLRMVVTRDRAWWE